jgi:hypothetical protein
VVESGGANAFKYPPRPLNPVAEVAKTFGPRPGPDADAELLGELTESPATANHIGRRFKNDTQRLETLFQMYTR